MCIDFFRRQLGLLAVLFVSMLMTPHFQPAHATEDCLFGDPALPISCDTCVIDDGGCCSTDPGCCFLSDRQYLLGDCLGLRPALADCGISLQADVTQFNFGVVEGGLEEDFRYSGHGDYVMNVDASKMGGPQGLFVKIRAEHRFGESLANATGAILPSTVLSELPTPESENLYITNLLFTQALSQSFAVFMGKLDTLDGDVNAFAHGRGKTQFSDSAFVATPIALRTVPYSTLGAGFVFLDGAEPIFTFTVLNPRDTAKTAGFNELFNDGVTLTAELRRPTKFFGKPGHQLIAGTWSSRDYVALDQDPRIILPSVPIARANGSWSVYGNFDQYLFTDRCEPEKGWGIFGRAGIADPRSNPIAWFLSFGIGGDSPIAGRSQDGFGVGWYYAALSNDLAPFINAALGGLGDGQGIELFYRAQMTPWFHVTPDVQILWPGRDNVDTTYIVGLRSNISF